MLNEEEEDDVSFYVQKSESTVLKSVSGTNTSENLAEQRVKTDRETSTGTIRLQMFAINKNYFITFFFDKDETDHVPRVRRPSIVIREHQLSQYPVNYDPSPHIIRKKVDANHEHVVYKQQIAVRYLCPPTPPPPAPLIIREVRGPEPTPLPPS